MDLPLLQTKLYIPPARTALVHRSRLLERLDEGTQRKLTLIAAPAGFGKTTLVSDWLRQRDLAAAWLSLDEHDNDPIRFLTYLVAALQQVCPDIGLQIPGLLATPRSAPDEQVITLLVHDLTQHDAPCLLVLDDYHIIGEGRVHHSLTFLLTHLPENVHLVMTSRRDPPFPLPRMRVRGELMEIREEHLRFSQQETAEFFRQSGAGDLDSGAVHQLRERTEGWVAGLQMAAISLRDRSHKEDFVAQFSGSHRYVADYLMDEVLEQQPPEVRQFLLRTSVLDRFNPEICQYVTRCDDCRELLDRVERAKLLLVPLDANRNWYRYHHLFRDFLRHRMQLQQPDEPRQITLRASRWFEQHHLIEEAIEMALAAGDANRAADLIEHTPPAAVWQTGQWATLLHWLDELPGELIAARPQLCLYHAWGLMVSGDVAAVEGRLQDAERAASGTSSQTGAVLGQAAAIRATIARFQGDLPTTVAQSRQALELLPENDTFWRASTALNLGTIHFLADDADVARQALAEAQATAKAAGNAAYGIVATSFLAQLHVRLGRLQQAARLYQQALARAKKQGRSLYTTGMAHVGLAEVFGEWNALDTAVQHAEQGLALGERVGNPLILVSGHITTARLLQARGEMEAALAHIQQAETDGSLLEATWTWLHVPVDAYIMRIWLAQNQIDLATAIAARIQDAQAGAPGIPGFLAEGQTLALARMNVAQGHYASAQIQLESLADAAEETGRRGSLIEIMALQAIVLQALGDASSALATLRDALHLAEPERFVRVFIDAGPTMVELLHQLPSSRYRDLLLGHFTPERDVDTLDTEACIEPQPLSEPLTGRELQILRLMAARLSNREIAEELYLATTTIKWYSRQIYGKLGVNDRRAAVARAEDLGII